MAYLVIDIGTGNTRVAVVSEEGGILSLARENSVICTDLRVKGAQYFDPTVWKATVFRLVRRALEQAGQVSVRAVTCSSLRQAIVLVGQDGESIVGFTNADRRGEEFMGELDWQRIWELTDLSPLPIFSAIKVLGASRREPELLERTAFYTSVSDWVGYLFTGTGVWERAQAIQSAVYDPVAGQWSNELCRIIGTDARKLPPLAEAGTVLGPVKPEVCRALGLAEDAVFVVGTADTQAAVVGASAEVGETVIVSGTTSPCVKIIPTFRRYPRTWVSPTAEPGRFMLEVNTASSGINLQRFKDMMMPDLSYEHLNADALSLGPAGARIAYAVCRVPHGDARGRGFPHRRLYPAQPHQHRSDSGELLPRSVPWRRHEHCAVPAKDPALGGPGAGLSDRLRRRLCLAGGGTDGGRSERDTGTGL